MLSRIAESLYWLGRYAERAEDTARILDVHYHLLLEERAVDEAVACRALLDVMGLGDRARADIDAGTVTNLLAYDWSYPGSIVGAVGAAWNNARGAREAVSSEMWRCLNTTYLALPAEVDRHSGQMPHAFFAWVKERCAMLAGLADSTMSHEDGWHFLVLGRSLERVDMTARLLSSRYVGDGATTGWVTTLHCCSAHEAYLRTYQRAVDASLAAEFLLLDRHFPRSVFGALSAAEDCLAALEPSSGRIGFEGDARRAIGRARTSLEFRTADDLLADLPRHLAAVQDDCAEAGQAIAARFFRQSHAIAWSA